MSLNRRMFRLWWGIGGGTATMVWSVAAHRWPELPMGSSATSATVYASGPGPPIWVRTIVLTAGFGLAIGTAAFMSLRRAEYSARRRRWFAAVWAAITVSAALANVYFAYHPGPDWLYSDSNPVLRNFQISMALSGLIGGFASGFLLQGGRPWRPLVAAGAWGLGGLAGGFVAPVALYILGAGFVDLTESLQLGALPGGLAGMFVAGFLIAYLIGSVGVLSVPAHPGPGAEARV